MHATVIRPYSHSFSDDEKLYKTTEEREAEARRDPLVRMRQLLLSEELATDEELAEAPRRRSSAKSTRPREQALAAPKPEPETAALLRLLSRRRSHIVRLRTPSRRPQGKPDTMVAAINATLRDEMARDPRIVVFGQDVADASREEALAKVPARAACSR